MRRSSRCRLPICLRAWDLPSLQPELNDKPVLGSQFVLRGSLVPAIALVITMIGFTDETANGGTVPLPFALAPMGAPSCFIRVDPVSTNLVLADATGGFLWIMPIGSQLGLRGIRFYQQFLAFDPAANALGVTVSNLLRSTTGDRYLFLTSASARSWSDRAALPPVPGRFRR